MDWIPTYCTAKIQFCLCSAFLHENTWIGYLHIVLQKYNSASVLHSSTRIHGLDTYILYCKNTILPLFCIPPREYMDWIRTYCTAKIQFCLCSAFLHENTWIGYVHIVLQKYNSASVLHSSTRIHGLDTYILYCKNTILPLFCIPP